MSLPGGLKAQRRAEVGLFLSSAVGGTDANQGNGLQAGRRRVTKQSAGATCPRSTVLVFAFALVPFLLVRCRGRRLLVRCRGWRRYRGCNYRGRVFLGSSSAAASASARPWFSPLLPRPLLSAAFAAAAAASTVAVRSALTAVMLVMMLRRRSSETWPCRRLSATSASRLSRVLSAAGSDHSRPPPGSRPARVPEAAGPCRAAGRYRPGRSRRARPPAPGRRQGQFPVIRCTARELKAGHGSTLF